MDRRGFLALMSAAGAMTLAGCAPIEAGPAPSATPTPAPPPRPVPASLGTPTPLPPPSPVKSIVKQPLPPRGASIYSLPLDGPFLAWTVDDGGNADVIRRYAVMARDTGTRLTFFPNGQYDGWAKSADILVPLIQSGQVQIGNHTYSHPDLTKLSNQGIIDELTKNDTYLQSIFGVSTKPFFRPPYGFHDSRVDSVAASIGYTNPVIWNGSLSDSGLLTQDQVVQFAAKYFLAKTIVIGHANYVPVCDVFPKLLQILKDRGLYTVTLNDVYKTA